MAKAISLSVCKTPHSAIRSLLGSNLVRILLSLARIYLRLHLNGISYVAIFSLLFSLFADVFVQVQPRIIFITGQIQQNMVWRKNCPETSVLLLLMDDFRTPLRIHFNYCWMNRYLYRYSLHQFDMMPRVYSSGCFTSAKPVVVRCNPVSGYNLSKSCWLAFFEIHPLGYTMLQPHIVIVITYKTRFEVGDVGKPRSQYYATGSSYSNSPQHH